MTLHWWMHWFWVTTLAITVISDMNVTTLVSENSTLHDNTELTTLDTTIQNVSTTTSTPNTTTISNISTSTDVTWRAGMYVTLANIPSNEHHNETSDTVITTSTEETIVNSSVVSEGHDTKSGNESVREGKAINTTNITYAEDVSASSSSGIDAAAVSAICFGLLVVLALSGATGFVLYRRRYLNRPQTLNDKCSDPDSSGYIDDSTVRENSEEMYSLDNDSFLNSLEAMTIQNYWTDSVKHTKL